MLIECIEKNPLAFHILPFDNPKAQHTLQAANMHKKQLWCREIKRVILENFDAAIPDKARDLVLNMCDIYTKSEETNPTVDACPDTSKGSIHRRRSTSVLRPGIIARLIKNDQPTLVIYLHRGLDRVPGVN